VIDFAYATVVTIRPVRRGEPFTRENVWVKRPGTGAILAEQLGLVLGRRAVRDLPSDVHVKPDDVDGFAAAGL
jgi:sialic acid synthase SpsE